MSVSYPIRSNNENYIQYIKAPEGKRLAVLFSYADGETIRIPTERNCYHLGIAIAKLHKSTINKRVMPKTIKIKKFPSFFVICQLWK